MEFDNLDSDKIFCFKDQLFFIKKGQVIDKKNKRLYKVKENAEFEWNDRANLLFQIYVDGDSDITCDVIDLSKEKMIERVQKYCGYSLKGQKLRLFCQGKIIEKELGTGI